MIAPLRDPSGSESSVANEPLRVARRLVAAALLAGERREDAPRIAAWKAWLFAGWLVLTVVAYGLSMMGFKL
jgi:hypothetical protein